MTCHWICRPRIVALALSLLLRIDHGHSMTACPMPFDEIQPDGSRVTLLLKGDEYFHIRTDLQGTLARLEQEEERRRKKQANSV
jgi:hypothetical protein